VAAICCIIQMLMSSFMFLKPGQSCRLVLGVQGAWIIREALDKKAIKET
jgi:hypothetical protein